MTGRIRSLGIQQGQMFTEIAKGVLLCNPASGVPSSLFGQTRYSDQ
jgi:hypothetical protein